MTKQELKQKYSEWNTENSYEAQKENDEIFHKMQDLNAQCGGDRWCNMAMLLRDLMKTDYYVIAIELYDKYRFNQGRIESVRDLAIATRNFEIKK